MQRLKIIVSGQVQGVGFRPFVFRLANSHALTGQVRNTAQGVGIEIQGQASSLSLFRDELQNNLPPLARISSFIKEEIAPVPGEIAFLIVSSEENARPQNILVSPDTATCPDCLEDIQLANDRRFAYPFTNCTNCGPRYSIISQLPYDRPFTSMSCFPMCDECRAEYENPADRRFHAQPNACPKCGPEVWLVDKEGNELSSGTQAVIDLALALSEGKIAAIKGLGGFHLACDALSAKAVTELRQRKNRPAKPFAIMPTGMDAAKALVMVSQLEQDALESTQAPIVLCKKNPSFQLPDGVAPGLDRVGIMLPYTPLQHILLDHFATEIKTRDSADFPNQVAALVMTSGNHTDEPIAIGNREAMKDLASIADVFLLHNRDILVRADDSVIRLSDSGDYHFMRRARGFAPLPLEFELLPAAGPAPSCTLGVGAELKNTICFARKNNPLAKLDAVPPLISGFVGQHIGDITQLGTENFMREIVLHLGNVFEFKPELIVRDMHPNYLSSLFAEELGKELGVQVLALQHHFAHAFSVLFENKHQGEALTLCLDGSGFGNDNSIWGGELIKANTLSGKAERIGHIARTLTPGGDAAAKEPWRMAQAYMFELGYDNAWFRQEFEQESSLLEQILLKKINCPINSSTGRMFDAIAGLLGFGSQNTPLLDPSCLGTGGSLSFEGQAAMWLESIQDKSEKQEYPCSIQEHNNLLILNTLELFEAAFADVQAGASVPIIARRFHLGLTRGLFRLAEAGAQTTGISTIGFSGGVMHNATLATLLPAQLREAKLIALEHHLLPPGDGCISFGQAAWGMLRNQD